MEQNAVQSVLALLAKAGDPWSLRLPSQRELVELVVVWGMEAEEETWAIIEFSQVNSIIDKSVRGKKIKDIYFS